MVTLEISTCCNFTAAARVLNQYHHNGRKPVPFSKDSPVSLGALQIPHPSLSHTAASDKSEFHMAHTRPLFYPCAHPSARVIPCCLQGAPQRDDGSDTEPRREHMGLQPSGRAEVWADHVCAHGHSPVLTQTDRGCSPERGRPAGHQEDSLRAGLGLFRTVALPLHL